MATNSVTRQLLLAMHDDFQQMKKDSPGLHYINRNKIDDFYRGSGSKRGNIEVINHTLNSIGKLQEKYFEFTDDEQPKIKFFPALPAIPATFAEDGITELTPAVPAVGDNEKPVTKDGLTYEQFNKEYVDLLNELVTLY